MQPILTCQHLAMLKVNWPANKTFKVDGYICKASLKGPTQPTCPALFLGNIKEAHKQITNEQRENIFRAIQMSNKNGDEG